MRRFPRPDMRRVVIVVPSLFTLFNLFFGIWAMVLASRGDRKSTRLNSSHSQISYAVFCLKNKRKDTTLGYSNCVFQRLRRHYSRYTPEMVERVSGIPKELFLKVADIYCSASGPDKTASAAYALQLNQSTNGVQQIRALCMLQLILGNVGRPGGGV